MRFFCFSDNHGRFYFKDDFVEEHQRDPFDVLIFCGDKSITGEYFYVEEMNRFLKEYAQDLPKILIAGNHDFCFQENETEAVERLCEGLENAHYLNNSSCEINGVKFWGSPYTPKFCNWAFMLRNGALKLCWDQIPDDTDVVITHGPPQGILDQTDVGEEAGCSFLRQRILKVAPKFHLFGHIHEAWGIKKVEETTFVNCSVIEGKAQVVTYDN